ncbi:hypothetical protein KP509_25G025100 [Ceratopteris richardii]|nr:hypothetical protein KP509_25G025100 [Ceratopteris richardii]
MYNYQQYRHIEPPGWILGWAWQGKEIIWTMVGAQATLQGDCSKQNQVPHSCVRTPTIVDLLPGVPYNMQVANCCRGGVLSSLAQDPLTAVASFQITTGLSGNRNTSVKLPKNFTLQTPGPGYTCGPASVIKPTMYEAKDGRRKTQALMTWSLVCTYSMVSARKTPPCCVSFSSFYNEAIVPCPACACGCEDKSTCYEEAPLQTVTDGTQPGITPQVIAPKIHCTQDMCPIRLHWHVKQNYKAYWRAKITISNRNYASNYSQWNAVFQHPNFDNLTEVFSFTYKSLNPYGDAINNTAMFWGIKYFNDLLMEAGPNGNVQSEILFQKDQNTFSFSEGWAFPQRVYFNGDQCVLPPPDAYPKLPNAASAVEAHISFMAFSCMIVVALICFI